MEQSDLFSFFPNVQDDGRAVQYSMRIGIIRSAISYSCARGAEHEPVAELFGAWDREQGYGYVEHIYGKSHEDFIPII